MALGRNPPRARGLRAAAAIAALLASSHAAHAADTVDLKFDWGPDLTMLRDVETLPASAVPLPPSSSERRDVPGMRYRLVARQQSDGSYEVRVIDFLMRTGRGDLLIPPESSGRQIIEATAPAARLDARGAFVALLEPDAAATLSRTMETSFQARLRSLPAAQQAEAKAQLEELGSLGYRSARAAFPWFESVGFWTGRRLEIGRWYSESVEERYVPLASARGPVRVQRRWRAAGWAPCDEPLQAAATAATAADGTTKDGPARASPRGDCVRLNLVSTFTPTNPSLTAQAEGRLEPRLESEIDLVTEPASLRPRRSIVTWRNRWRDAAGAEGVRDVQKYRMSWTYGPPALVALKGTLPSPPNAGPPPVEPANLKPIPEWAPGSPERTYVDFRAAVDSGDWSTAAALMHPEFLARVAKRLRGSEGAPVSDELRKAMFGDDVTAEQVAASSDLALVLLVTKRLADPQAGEGFGWDRPPSFSPGKVVLGHVEDREGRLHIVTQQDTEYRMPVEYRGSSSTVVLSLADERLTPAGASDAGALAPSCDPGRDVHRCWRIWRDSGSEYEPISRVQARVATARRTSTGPGVTTRPDPPVAPPAGVVAGAADPETTALRAVLKKALGQPYSTTATRADLPSLRALVGAPAFVRLDPAEQYQARVALGQGLLMSGDLADGLPVIREAAQSPLGLPPVYQLWAGAAVQLRQRAEAARAIQAWLKRFPDSVGLLDLRAFAEIDAEPPRTEEEKRELRQLYEAFFAAGDKVPYAEALDSRWLRLALLRLEDRSLPDPAAAAAEVVRRVDDTKYLMMMRADRRYDRLTSAHPELFDLARARAKNLQVAEGKEKAEPRLLARRLGVLRALLRSGQARQAVDQATSLIDSLTVADAPEVTLRDGPAPLAFDDAKEQLPWLYDMRSRGLALLGRFDEALQDNRRAMQAARYGRDAVSQLLNTAHRAVELGRAQDAMDLLARAPRASSPYGRMVYELARLRAAQQLDDRAVVGRALAYLTDNREDAPTLYLTALMYLPAERAAAEAEFQRLLDHPQDRLQLLYYLQRTARPSHPLPERDRAITELWALAETPTLRDAVNRVGRILDYPDVPFVGD
jgi:tetratricopeptide (TPR) repeat protein